MNFWKFSERKTLILFKNFSIASRKVKVALQLWTLSDNAETQTDMFDVAYLFGVRVVGKPLHSHPKNITLITPSPDPLLSKAFSVFSSQTHIC